MVSFFPMPTPHHQQRVPQRVTHSQLGGGGRTHVAPTAPPTLSPPGRPFCIWRVPHLGVKNLGKSVDSSQTRASVPTATRPSVRCAPDREATLRTAWAQRCLQTRVQTDNALKNSMFRGASSCADGDSPVMNWLDWCLQSRLPSTAGAATCLAMTTHAQVKLSAPELHHDCMLT